MIQYPATVVSHKCCLRTLGKIILPPLSKSRYVDMCVYNEGIVDLPVESYGLLNAGNTQVYFDHIRHL